MSLVLYEQEKKVLDAALASGGGHLDFATSGKAVQFRHRLYTFRKLYRESVDPASPYDRLSIPKLAKGQTRVYIEVKTLGTVFVPKEGGEPVAGPEPMIADNDPLLLDALNLAEDILGKN